MNTLYDVKKTVRSLVGDDEGSWTGDGYLIPKINFAYRTAIRQIETATGQTLERNVEIPAYIDPNGNQGTQGLTSLYPQQQPGKPLFGLYQPMEIYWKPAGSQPRFYRQAVEKETLPFALPFAGNWWSPMYWTWQNQQLQTTPLNVIMDILVLGRFQPPDLEKDEDVLAAHPSMESLVTPMTLGLIGIEAGNPNFQSSGKMMADMAMNDICNLLTLAKQGYTARGGRMARSHGGLGWYWW